MALIHINKVFIFFRRKQYNNQSNNWAKKKAKKQTPSETYLTITPQETGNQGTWHYIGCIIHNDWKQKVCSYINKTLKFTPADI